MEHCINKASTFLVAGVGSASITPYVGAPSAGYPKRNKKMMQGVHDPLLATALFLDNGEQKLIFCSVDHLGFTYEMVQKITQKIQSNPSLAHCALYIGSSHTHSGGGGYISLSAIEETLTGKYNPHLVDFYIDKTIEAILQAASNPIPATIGIGYGHTSSLTKCREHYCNKLTPLFDLTLLKVVKTDGTPLALLFHYPIHPTLLKSDNLLFSADVIGYVRKNLQDILGTSLHTLYFNGAQAEVIPNTPKQNDPFTMCSALAAPLAAEVEKIWENTLTSSSLICFTKKLSYRFPLQPTKNLSLSLRHYESELNLLVLNKKHFFITIPGELSCTYDRSLKQHPLFCHLQNHITLLGLTNDAHGYILPPQAWEEQMFETHFSFGGKYYGEDLMKQVCSMIEAFDDGSGCNHT